MKPLCTAVRPSITLGPTPEREISHTHTQRHTLQTSQAPGYATRLHPDYGPARKEDSSKGAEKAAMKQFHGQNCLTTKCFFTLQYEGMGHENEAEK